MATRHAAEDAQTELANRGTLHAPEHEMVTATEWATTGAEADAAEDPHRQITEHDIIDHERDQQHDLPDGEVIAQAKQLVQPADTLDLREITAHEPRGADENTVRVPAADETADAVNRAVRALAELRARTAMDNARAAEEERYAQIARWHRDDHAADYDLAAGHDDGADLGY